MSDMACGPLEAVEGNPVNGRPDGFFRGRCRCGFVSTMARGSTAEADADAEAHRQAERNAAGVTGDPVRDSCAEALARLADITVMATAEGPILGPDAGAFGELAEAARRWLISAFEHERRSRAIQSAADVMVAELRGRLDDAWALLGHQEEAGKRTVRTAALRLVLNGEGISA